ncbi:FecR domain-containing protein [Pseudomonadota bacterium]
MQSSSNHIPENSDQSFEDLFRDISARPHPPAEAEQAAFEQFSADLDRLRSKHARNKKVTYWALAATVLLAVLVQPVLFQPGDTPGSLVALGTVNTQHGQVSVLPGQQRPEPGLTDTAVQLYPQQTVVAGAGAGLSIDWGGNKSIRVDQNTRLLLRSANEIELASGRIYVDVPPHTAQNPPGDSLHIVTRLATISHTGTQFMVAADDDAVEVKVREGTVSIANGSRTLISGRGEQTVVDDSGTIQTNTTNTYGADWQWVEELAPSYTLEGSTLENFLYWVQRETGKDMHYESTEAHHTATDTILHGSIDLQPMDSLAMVLETTDLSWYEQGGIIYLSLNH